MKLYVVLPLLVINYGERCRFLHGYYETVDSLGIVIRVGQGTGLHKYQFWLMRQNFADFRRYLPKSLGPPEFKGGSAREVCFVYLPQTSLKPPLYLTREG